MEKDENILSLETLKNLYELVATNLRFAGQRYGNKDPVKESQIKEGDLVLIKNNTKRGFEPRFLDNYRVIKVKGQQVEVRPAIGGDTKWAHITHVKPIFPADNIIASLPDYSTFGRKTTLRLNPDKIPDLNWNIATQLNTTPTTTSGKNTNAMAEMFSTSINIKEVISFPFETFIVKKSR